MDVTTVNELVRKRLEAEFVSVWVAGELGGVNKSAAGHLFFTLTDGGSQLRCVMLRGFVLRNRMQLRTGMSVRVRGQLSVHVPKGQFQMTVLAVEHTQGEGNEDQGQRKGQGEAGQADVQAGRATQVQAV